jgi:hypothetical protein
VALAQPIPRYFRGKDESDNYEGPAIVDDGGRPEAIVRADGSIEIGSNRPRMTWVGRDDIVIPDARQLAWNNTIAANNMINQRASVPDSSFTNENFSKGIYRLEKAIKKIKPGVMPRPDPLGDWVYSNRKWGNS